MALSVSGCASKKPEGKTLAKFAGETIMESDFLNKTGGLPRELQAAAFRRRDDFLQDLVGERFLLREAQKRNIDKDPEVSALLTQAKNKILVSRLIQLEVDNKLKFDPDEAERYYDLHKDDFMTPLMLRASHILVKTEEEARDIKATLDSGGDFEETARHKSIDPTAIRGGDLGFFQKGQFVREFEDAVFAMKKNEIRGPIQSQFGWHLIKLTDRVEPTQRSFESVRSRIEERMMMEKRSDALKELLGKLKGNVKVEIDEKALAAIQLPPSEKAVPETTVSEKAAQ